MVWGKLLYKHTFLVSVSFLSYVFSLSIGTDRFSKKCRPCSDAANAASVKGQHFLPIIKQFLTIQACNKMALSTP